MLAVHLGGVERTVKINLHNTQFIALDTKVQEFKEGYEPEISALLDALLPDAGTFFDIGANWGYFSIYVASRVAFTGRIEAFEPVSKTFRDLTGLITDLDLGGRVRCHAIAVAEHNGKALISTGGLHSGMASLVNAQRGEEVQTARLDSLELPLPDAIKIDVEGYEANVIRGARRIISEGRPMIIFENLLHPGRPDLTLAPFQVLQDMDYIFYLTRYDVPAETLILTPLTAAERFGYAAHANILACHASKRKALEYPASRAASDVRAKSAFSPRSVSAEQ
jgi:FkbM family methyltransferase